MRNFIYKKDGYVLPYTAHDKDDIIPNLISQGFVEVDAKGKPIKSAVEKELEAAAKE